MRPTWLEVLREEGVDVNSAAALAKVVVQRGMTVEELLSPVSDQCWPDVWETTWSPPERAERLLKQLKVGSALRSSEPTAGRLHFHCGDNHPGSSDVWVEVDDDLSATLLQARLVELGQPIAVIMETPSVQRDEDGWR